MQSSGFPLNPCSVLSRPLLVKYLYCSKIKAVGSRLFVNAKQESEYPLHARLYPFLTQMVNRLQISVYGHFNNHWAPLV